MNGSELDFGAAVPLGLGLVSLFVVVRIMNMIRAIVGGRV